MADEYLDNMFNLTFEQECEREAEQRELERQDSEREYQEAMEEERRENERVSFFLYKAIDSNLLR